MSALPRTLKSSGPSCCAVLFVLPTLVLSGLVGISREVGALFRVLLVAACRVPRPTLRLALIVVLVVLGKTPLPAAAQAAAVAVRFTMQVVPFVGVPLWAVGRSGGAGCDGVTAQDVLSLADGAAMVGVAASTRPVVAREMVKFHAIRDGADLTLIAVAVDELQSAGAVRLAVAAFGAGALPDVAAVRVYDPSHRGALAVGHLSTAERDESAMGHTSNLAHSFNLFQRIS